MINKKIFSNCGFTLAEVLIVLAIIGVVAALTIPTLMAKNAKIEYVAALKKAYSQMENGFSLIMANEGVSRLGETSMYDGTGYTNVARNNKIETTMKKYFNIAKSCKNDDTSCRIDGYKELDGADIGDAFTETGYKFYTADGMAFQMSLADTCDPDFSIPGKMKAFCGSILVDINGAKLPNKMGRDYFIFDIGYDGHIYPEYSIDYAKFSLSSESYEGGGDYWKDTPLCPLSGSTDVTGIPGDGCAAKIMEESWQMNY